jgi:hypothetical protein
VWSGRRRPLHRGDVSVLPSQIKRTEEGVGVQEALIHPNNSVSSITSFYPQDILWNCETIFGAFEDIEARWEKRFGQPYKMGDGYMIIDSEFQRSIINIIMAAANIRDHVKPSSVRGSSETKASYNYRMSRLGIFQSILKNLGISEIYNVGVRNALEHFDEKLDGLIRKAMRESDDRQPSKAYNLTFSDRPTFERALSNREKAIMLLRVYFVEEGEFFIFDQHINVKTLVSEAKAIHQHVGMAFSMSQDPGGVFII